MKLKYMRLPLLSIMVAASVLSGCASYRTNSSISEIKNDIAVIEGVPNIKYKELAKIEGTVKKLTLFHKDPTKEQVNVVLIEKARTVGADAVIKVTYKSGISATTYGYITASGVAIKYVD